MLKAYSLLLLLLTGSLLKAQDEKKLADNIYYKQLPNGLEMMVVEDHTVPLATIDMAFKAGAINQLKSESGLIPLYCALTMRGNQKYATSGDFSYRAGGIGLLNQNRITSYEETDFYFTLPKANLHEGLEYMSLPIRYPLLSPVELEKEKQLFVENIRQKNATPSFPLFDETGRQLWGDLEYRKKPTGDTDVVRSATAAMMNTIKKKYFNPDNALLIVGGDIDHTAAFTEMAAMFADWQSTEDSDHGQWLAPEFKPLEKSKYFIVPSELARAPLILVQWQGPDTRKDINATYAADVFSYILSQNSAKLRTALLNSGLATSVSISYLTLKHTGPISLQVSPNPAKVKECIDEINRQISMMDSDDYISDEQISTAKRMLEIEDIRREDITSDFVHTMAFWWAAASLDYYFSYLDNLRQVTHADLKRYAHTYITNRPCCEGLLINPEQRAQIKADDFFGTGK